jgi:cell division protein FtsQ
VTGVADQAVEERTRRRPGTGWRLGVRRGDTAPGDGDEAARARRFRLGVPALDDLPDPSPDATGGAGGTVPAAAGPADEPSPDPAPDIDPRIHQRRLDVQAEEGRHRTRLLTAATSVLVAAAVAFGVLRSPLLTVRRPRVSGEVQTPAADVLRAAGLVGHPLMIDLALGRSASAIARLPWIASARVRRSWPDTVIVTVTERVPAAVITGMLVDASGRVLSIAPGFTPLLTVGADRGQTPSPLPKPGGVVPPTYRPGLLVVTAVPPALRPHIGSVLVGPDATVRLSLVGGALAVLGDTSDLAQKLEAVLTIVARVRIGQVAIDVTVPSAPVLTSLAAAGTVSTRTGG